MKHLSKVVLGISALFLLAGCGGPSKVEFAKFQEAAQEAVKKENPYGKVTVKGYDKTSTLGVLTETKYDHVFELVDGEWKCTKGETLSAIGALVYTAVTVSSVSQAEDKNCSYYVGGGFKVVNNEDKNKVMTFNEYGLLLSAKDLSSQSKQTDVKVTWSK